MDYIKIADREPEEGVDVLLYLDNGDAAIGYRNSYGYYYTYGVYDSRHPDQVKAWMPIPEYREDDSDD